MTTIAFIGLGIMGSPMAVHLQNAGHDVVRLQPPPRAHRAAGRRRRRARPSSIAEAVSRRRRGRGHGPRLARTWRTCWPARTASSPPPTPGTLVIDFSSIRPDVTATLAASGQGEGLPAARRAGLRRRGGREERGTVDHGRRRRRGLRRGQADPRRRRQDRRPRRPATAPARPSRRPTSSSSRANIQALAEALVFLEAYGVDTEAALEVLGGGLAGSKVLDQKRSNMLDRSRSSPGFRIDLHHKDMGIVTVAAREAGVVAAARRDRRPS